MNFNQEALPLKPQCVKQCEKSAEHAMKTGNQININQTKVLYTVQH